MIHKEVSPCKIFYQYLGANPALNSDVDQDTFGKVTKHNTHEQTRQHNTPT